MDESNAAAIVRRVSAAGALAKRLGRTFARNPWTLVTLLSFVASIVSVLESLSAMLGAATPWVLAGTAALLLLGVSQRRRHPRNPNT